MTPEAALAKLGDSTARAATSVLERFAAGQVEPGGVSVVSGEGNPLEGIPVPAVATSVSYVDGVTGGNVLLMPLEGARRLAAAMMGGEAPADGGAELSELEVSAVAEAANQIMASAAAATSAVLGTEVEIGAPETRTFSAAAEAADAYPPTPHAVRVTFTVCGETCRLLQLVPNAFVVRMTKALDELGAELHEHGGDAGGHDTAAATSGADHRPSLAGIPVRVWAELGRTRMPSASLVELPPGAVVELDRHPDDAVDVFVNGSLLARGRLMVVDGNEWAVRIETVLRPTNPTDESQMEVARWPVSW